MNTTIYTHSKPNGEIFYIGIGDSKRPYSRSGRSKFWHNTVNKYGNIITILSNNLTWENAQQAEIELIKIYGRRDLGLGLLCNLTDGGEGSPGVKRSKEAIEKQKLTMQNKTSEEKQIISQKISKAQVGKKLSIEHCKKLSIINKGNKHCLGRICSEETKVKIRKSNIDKKHNHTEEGLKNVQKNQYQKGHSIHNKKVINTETGEIYDSAKICHEKEKLKITCGHLRDMMSGLKNNNTIYKYYINEGK